MTNFLVYLKNLITRFISIWGNIPQIFNTQISLLSYSYMLGLIVILSYGCVKITVFYYIVSSLTLTFSDFPNNIFFHILFGLILVDLMYSSLGVCKMSKYDFPFHETKDEQGVYVPLTTSERKKEPKSRTVKDKYLKRCKPTYTRVEKVSYFNRMCLKIFKYDFTEISNRIKCNCYYLTKKLGFYTGVVVYQSIDMDKNTPKIYYFFVIFSNIYTSIRKHITMCALHNSQFTVSFSIDSKSNKLRVISSPTNYDRDQHHDTWYTPLYFIYCEMATIMSLQHYNIKVGQVITFSYDLEFLTVINETFKLNLEFNHQGHQDFIKFIKRLHKTGRLEEFLRAVSEKKF